MSTSIEPISLRFDAHGLIPVVAQDAESGDVLLLAYMNTEALDATLATGALTLWSRSRGALWRKGETSGHTLRVRELRVNCEENSLLARVELAGPGACHEGYRSCYYRALTGATTAELTARVVESRVFDPATVYVSADAAPASGEGGDDAALERDLRALYAAYERLRDAPPIAGSRTSTLLHEPDAQRVARQALARAQEELEELRGVLVGTHRHAGGERDVILEASQVGYWVTVAAVAQRVRYDDWAPHRAWLSGWYDAPSSLEARDADAPTALAAPLGDAGALCRAAGVHPARVIAADLADMRRKHVAE